MRPHKTKTYKVPKSKQALDETEAKQNILWISKALWNMINLPLRAPFHEHNNADKPEQKRKKEGNQQFWVYMLPLEPNIHKSSQKTLSLICKSILKVLMVNE